MEGAKAFLKAWARKYGAVYLMASTPADFAYPHDEPKEPGWPSATDLVDDVLVPVARDLGLPLALKLGARRAMAPDLNPCGGGDGVVSADTAPLVGLCKSQGRKRVIQRRINVGVLEALFKRKASTL